MGSFGLSLTYINNTLSAAKYLAPLVSFCFLMRWDPIFDAFAPESIIGEIVYDMLCTAYLTSVVGPATQFDSIAVSIWGVGFNMVWLFLHILRWQQREKIIERRLPRCLFPGLLAGFALYMAAFFWALQTGFKCDSVPYCRETLGYAALLCLILEPLTSVINRLHSKIPDDPWEPYVIKMAVAVITGVTCAFSTWSQHKQGYDKDNNLSFIFSMSYVGTGIAIPEIVVRYIGPLRISIWVRQIGYWIVQKIKGFWSGLCGVSGMLCGCFGLLMGY